LRGGDAHQSLARPRRIDSQPFLWGYKGVFLQYKLATAYIYRIDLTCAANMDIMNEQIASLVMDTIKAN